MQVIAMKLLKPALVYFAAVFGAGFVLGPIRVLWLIPKLGGEHAERYAELMEVPLMLVVIWLAARWLVRRFPAPTGTAPRSHFLRVGLLALAFIVAAEMLLGWKLRGLTPLEYFTLQIGRAHV